MEKSGYICWLWLGSDNPRYREGRKDDELDINFDFLGALVVEGFRVVVALLSEGCNAHFVSSSSSFELSCPWISSRYSEKDESADSDLLSSRTADFSSDSGHVCSGELLIALLSVPTMTGVSENALLKLSFYSINAWKIPDTRASSARSTYGPSH